ncbi:MAG: hypothetical protein SVV03_04450 [Candidatus Nanohaloarchaea archaeon]|nr:hypothetical protein [Candidatus Nanohaloarchaea archaeon]
MDQKKDAQKGQMSLEFVVGFVILLVVAGIVIALVLTVFPTAEGGEEAVAGKVLEINQIKSQCRQKCQNWKGATGKSATSAAIEYCIQRYNYDSNDDGSLSQVGGQGYNSYCENGVRCFNVYSCQNDYQKLDAEKCKELMCEYYQDPEVVEDTSKAKAGRRVYRFFQPGKAEKNRGVGTCGLKDVTDATGFQVKNWWTENFQPENGDPATVCGGVSSPGTGEEPGTGDGGTGAVCGDGICQATETAESCSQDCGGGEEGGEGEEDGGGGIPLPF